MAAPKDGQGATVQFLTSSYVGRTQVIGGWETSVAMIDDTELIDTDERSEPGVLKSREPFEVTLILPPGDTPPIGIKQQVRVNAPLGVGENTAAYWLGDGYIASVTRPPYQHGENLIGSYTVKWSHVPTKTAAT